MKNSHKCNFSVMREWQKHHQRDGLMVFVVMC